MGKFFSLKVSTYTPENTKLGSHINKIFDPFNHSVSFKICDVQALFYAYPNTQFEQRLYFWTIVYCFKRAIRILPKCIPIVENSGLNVVR